MLFLLSSFYNCRCKLFSCSSSCSSSSSCRCCCWVDVVVVAAAAAMCNCCCTAKANRKRQQRLPDAVRVVSFICRGQSATRIQINRAAGGRGERQRDRGRLPQVLVFKPSLLLTSSVHCSCPMSANSSAFLSACSLNTQTHSNCCCCGCCCCCCCGCCCWQLLLALSGCCSELFL